MKLYSSTKVGIIRLGLQNIQLELEYTWGLEYAWGWEYSWD